MPIYEYKCRKCDHVFERVAKNFEAAPKHPGCPKKGKDDTACKGKTDRLVSGGGFQLKGGGWAEDGY